MSYVILALFQAGNAVARTQPSPVGQGFLKSFARLLSWHDGWRSTWALCREYGRGVVFLHGRTSLRKFYKKEEGFNFTGVNDVILLKPSMGKHGRKKTAFSVY